MLEREVKREMRWDRIGYTRREENRTEQNKIEENIIEQNRLI